MIVVLASEAVRLARLVGDRRMEAEEARARMAVQATDDQRRAIADIMIENEGTQEELRDAVDAVWRDQLLPRSAGTA